MTSRMI